MGGSPDLRAIGVRLHELVKQKFLIVIHFRFHFIRYVEPYSLDVVDDLLKVLVWNGGLTGLC